MAAPNIVNVTQITGKSVGVLVTTSTQTPLTNPASSGEVYKVNTIIAANVNGTAAASVTVALFRNSVEYRVASGIFVPAGASLVVVSKDAAFYMEEGDALRIRASQNSYIHAIISYELIK